MIIVIDNGQMDGIRVHKFSSIEEMLSYVQHRELKFIEVYRLGEEIKLKNQPSVILDTSEINTSVI